MAERTVTRASSRTKIQAQPTELAIRSTRTRAPTSKTPAPTPGPDTQPAKVVKKPASRKPLVNRDNAVDPPPLPVKSKAKPAARKATKAMGLSDVDREPIMAYLRIRPQLSDEGSSSTPYLTPLSDTLVRMSEPQSLQNNRARFRPSNITPSSTYTFSHIFGPNTTQADFFSKTTLPLVKDALHGQNGLIFTYGVTNSGKTYTIQGGTKEGTSGILPRTLDVIFNSIEGLHGEGRFRPVRLHGVEQADPTDLTPSQILPEPTLAAVLGQHLENTQDVDHAIDPTSVKVDRNYEYTMWLSYVEVYNEKVYDLLASVKGESDINYETTAARAPNGKTILLTRQALPLKPSPTCDNADSEINGKYISGLKQFRVQSSSQAKALVKLGQLHRRVFGTLANKESSRSHGMVIIKIVRGHRGERNDPTSLQISRLTLVDLAGSERTKHTHTTGDRLKEAGNINKSLMVLGQCMEVMRSNQRKIAMSLSQEGIGEEGRMDTRDIKRTLAIVPFRHSKLTEALMDYFTGDGRVVMIVNVNPFDTGYDENSHVMKFAALAREVYVTPAPVPQQRVPGLTGPGKTQGTKIKALGPMSLNDPDINPHPYRRKVTISMGGPAGSKKGAEAVLEVLEEDEPKDEQETNGDDDDPGNNLIETLFDEVESLRMQLFESEMRCAVIEAETREEVMREMEDRMRSMELMYSRRLMSELERNEMKTDAKIDLLHHSGMFASPRKATATSFQGDSISEEEDVEKSLVHYDEEGESSVENDATSMEWRSEYESPLAKKESSRARSAADNASSRNYTDDSEESDVQYLSSSNQRKRKTPSGNKPAKPPQATSSKPVTISHVSQLAQSVKDLSIQNSPADSVVVLPSRKFNPGQASGDIDEDDYEYEYTAVKKKKRQLGKKPVVTEEDIERVTYTVEKAVTKKDGTIRRMRGS